MQFPASHTYRPALAVAFLVCLLWLVLLSCGAFERMVLPSEAKALVVFFTPLSAAIAILYRTPLFREMRQSRRFVNLFRVALALLVCAGALLLTLSLVLFALGIISPP